MKVQKIASLGPMGSFSEAAVQKYLNTKNLKCEIIFFSSIFEVFESVENGKCELGLAPVENSIEGSVNKTLEELFNGKIYITDAIDFQIVQCLVAKKGVSQKNIKTIYSHQQALAQTHRFLTKNLKNAKLFETPSTSAAFEKIINLDSLSVAAIGSEEGAKKYGLEILEKNIQDVKKNITRFLVLSKTQPQTGSVSSIVLYDHKDRPGLLYDLLGVFKSHKINLTRIESRPARTHLGEYRFFIDCESNLLTNQGKNIIKEITKQGFRVKVLGVFDVVK